MKTFLSILLGSILLPVFVFSQANKSPHKTLVIITNGVVAQDVLTHYLIINSSDIESLELLNITDAKKKYKDDSLEVAMKVTPKNWVKLIGLADFYQLHNISNSSQSFPICIDGEVVKKYDDMLIEDSEVKSVEVRNDTIIISTNMAYTRLMKANKKVQ